jgi:hypothetical protein
MAKGKKINVALTQREQAMVELRRLWDQGIASGPAKSGEQVIARIRSRLDGDRQSS